MEMPHFLASQTYSDVQFQMLHITHPSKQQEFFEMFRKLKHNEIFTDISFVTKGQRILKIHRLVLASFSSFMKDLFQETTVPDMNYTLILPDVEYSDVEALCHILYGVDVAVPRSRFEKISKLAEMLGIPASKLKTPEDFLLDKNEPRLAAASAFSRENNTAHFTGNNTVSAAAAATVQVQNVNKQPIPNSTDTRPPQEDLSLPPLCCWHCNRTFSQLEDFQTHLESHKGEKYKSKRHKCTKCKKIFPTMWKLRTHLLTHSTPKKLSKRSDHEYAEPLKNYPSTPAQNSQPVRKPMSDHPYANPTDAVTPAPAAQHHHYQAQPHNVLSRSLQQGSDHVQAQGPTQQQQAVDPLVITTKDLLTHHVVPQQQEDSSSHNFFPRHEEAKAIISIPEVNKQLTGSTKVDSERVCTEHSYGTRQRLASIREGDHAYSTKMPDNVDPDQIFEIIETTTTLNKNLKGSAKRKASLKAKKNNLSLDPNVDQLIIQNKRPILGNKYTCDLCGKTFPQPYRKNRHVMEVHKKEKRHTCRFCDKQFFKMSSKKRHELIHVEHDNWKCKACSKTFKDQSSLKYHTKNKVCQSKNKEEKAKDELKK